MGLDKLVAGSMYTLEFSSTTDGTPVDYRTTPATLVLDYTGYSDGTTRITIQHTPGSNDLSQSAGAYVKFALTPAQTKLMAPGNWKVYVADGTPGTTLQGVGPATLLVELPPRGALPTGGP